MQILGSTYYEVTRLVVSQIVLEESKEKFGKKFEDMDFVTDLFAPVYAKYFTQADLDSMLAFWSTPTGRKNLEAAATLTQETFAAIQQVTFGISPAFQRAVDAASRTKLYLIRLAEQCRASSSHGRLLQMGRPRGQL